MDTNIIGKELRDITKQIRMSRLIKLLGVLLHVIPDI
jgi:hypothetical protein